MTLLPPSELLTLDQAREIIARAVAKTPELKQRGAFVIVDDGGNVVSISRMDGAGPTGIGVSRAKAYVAAVNREPSARFTTRLGGGHPGLFSAYQDILRGHVFPGPGALPIRRNGQVIGALSTGSGLGPAIKADGVDPSRFLVDGKPANAEDLIICHALGIPYQGQHGDDVKRWTDAYGTPPPDQPAADADPPGDAPAPPPALAAALACADRALAKAAELGVQVAIALTDRHGDVIQLDRMDGAGPTTPDAAAAKAMTAINYRRPSRDVADLLERSPHMAVLGEIGHFTVMPLPGGLPARQGDDIIGAVGVAGARPDADEEIARVAIGAPGEGA